MSTSDRILDPREAQVDLKVVGLAEFDPAVLEHVVAGAQLEHRRLKGGGPDFNILQCVLPHSVINRGAYEPAVLVNGTFARNTITIGVMLSQQHPTLVNGVNVRTGTLQFYAENTEMCYRAWPDATWLAFVISREQLFEFCLEHFDKVPKFPQTGIAHIEPRSDVLGARLLTDLRDLDRSLRPLSNECSSARLAESVERDLLARFSSVICKHSSNQICSENRRLLHCREMFRDAMNLVEQDTSEMLDLHLMSRVTGFSPRTLQRTFQAELGLCPQEWFRIERLNRVHDDLLNGRNGESVTQAATRWGFFHLSRFAHYYRELFGETPVETLRSRRSYAAATSLGKSLVIVPGITPLLSIDRGSEKKAQRSAAASR
jgi:AraC-like DNA-binding protein